MTGMFLGGIENQSMQLLVIAILSLLMATGGPILAGLAFAKRDMSRSRGVFGNLVRVLRLRRKRLRHIVVTKEVIKEVPVEVIKFVPVEKVIVVFVYPQGGQ